MLTDAPDSGGREGFRRFFRLVLAFLLAALALLSFCLPWAQNAGF